MRKLINTKKYQIVNHFPDWIGFKFKLINIKETDLALIFRFTLGLGFWEIRKWVNNVG